MDRQLISRIERIEASVDRLLGSNLRVTVRGGGSGGSGGGISTVDIFPAIPAQPRLVHFSGDNALWFAAPGHTHWYPCSDWTDYDGTPGEEA